MAVAFNQIPTNIRPPLFYAEVNSGLSYFAGNSKHLVIGQKLAGGSAPADVPQIVQLDDIEARFGAGSMLVDMISVAKKNNPIGEIWALPLADPAGVAAVWTATIAGTLTPGAISLYIEGRKIVASVTAADTVTTVAAALASAINAGYVDLDGQTYLHPVSATSALGVVTLTARHAGLVGNTIGIEKDYVGDEGPNAALITIAATTPGTGTPSLTAGLAACGATEFDMISFPYADATSLNAMRDFLGARWEPMQGLYGGAFTANAGNLSAQSTLGNARNDPNTHIMGYNGSPTSVWVWAAAVGAQVQAHKNLGADLTQAGEISRPMHTIILKGVKPPKDISKRWTPSDLQTLYYDGVSGYHVTPDGQVAIDRLISTYQQNSWGSPDTTWLDVETRYQTAYALRYLKQVVTQTYARVALVPDNPGNLQGFATLTDIKSTIIHAYSRLVDEGVMKNKQLFADNLVVEQAADPNRVNVYLPFDVVNQLRIFAANATTFLNAAAV
jgi:phage tail sheath gpL-like